MEDFYAILECNPESSLEEIKSSFQKLALKYHPDKATVNSTPSTTNDEFVKISKAWKVLGNESSRKEYDARWKQRCMAQTWPIQDDVDIEDFDIEGDTLEHTHGCRCGGLFRLTKTDVFYHLDIVACEFCSLCVRINYDNQDEANEDDQDFLKDCQENQVDQSPPPQSNAVVKWCLWIEFLFIGLNSGVHSRKLRINLSLCATKNNYICQMFVDEY